ncbi:MAG: sodium-translocating pyrophosphatase [Alphaproteobacteria bacterium]|nr:sodium-translocating pyrophosphatase [Alphaproteobacteria bacterium]
MEYQFCDRIIWGSVIGAAALVCILFSTALAMWVMRQPQGSSAMKKIATAIQEGAQAYLKKQYSIIAVVGVIAAFLLEYCAGWHMALGFTLGAVLSGVAGFVGMHVSVRANVRTAQAATKGIEPAFKVAFYSGAVTGFLVKGLALLGLFPILWWLVSEGSRTAVETLVALSFGASLISIFARLGGGIFTKGADVGADLVGKIESKIPEDDPRNPAVIADNVGDNVGDCAGMAADLFETYVVTIVANVLIGCAINVGSEAFIMYPALIAAVTSVASIIGVLVVRLRDQNIMKTLYTSLLISAALSTLFIFLATQWFTQTEVGMMAIGEHFSLRILIGCAGVGILLTLGLVWITEYYTSCSFKPVRSIGDASQKGHATNIIQGLAVSFEATVVPTIMICAAILTAYLVGGLYGLAIAATTMLSLSAVVITLDAYGPITDNAGGIAEMSHMDSKVRKITDQLDAVGNTTKAVTKGYAIGSAALAALVIFAVYVEDLSYYFPKSCLTFSLTDPFVIVGLLVGGMLPFFFAGLSMTAVGRVGGRVVEEVRRQFREKPGILTGKDLPDYGKSVTILTQSAIQEMVFPSLLPVLTPIVFFHIIQLVSNTRVAFISLGALILGVTLTGLFLALSMTSGGGAWDNAKKFIEDGAYGGKGSVAHEASITGDTVGDPYKDTAGPAINPMIKIVNIVAIILLMVVYKMQC